MSRGPAGVLAIAACALLTGNAFGGPVLLIEDQGGFGDAAQVLENEGFETTVVNNEFDNGHANLLNTAFLQQFDFIVYGERGDGLGDLMTQNVSDSLEAYIQSGGDLLVTGYDTLGDPFDPILAELVRSATAGDRASFSPQWQTMDVDHPILNGPYGDFRGMEFEGSGFDDDNLTADNLASGEGSITLAVTPGETDRLIVADVGGRGGSVGYWNGGLSTDNEMEFGLVNAQPDFSFGGNPQGIFLNYAAYGNEPPVPEPASAVLLVVGGCGLLAGYGRRRRPLA